jgi:hypothetical protein
MERFHSARLWLEWRIHGHVPGGSVRGPAPGALSLPRGVDATRGAAHGQPLASDWVTHAVISGLLASLVMLCGFLIAYGLATLLASASLAGGAAATVVHEWLYALVHNAVLAVGLSRLYVAVAAYLVGGVLWALVYARFGAPFLAGPHWWRGLGFSLLPAAVSVVVVLPLLGGGLLGAAIGAGPLPVLGNLLLHALYGSTLGLLYGPLGYRSAEDFRPLTIAQRQAMAGAERVALRAILAGGLLGTVVGVVGLALGVGAAGRLNLPPAAVLLASVLGGTVVGLFVGFVIGQAETPEPPV